MKQWYAKELSQLTQVSVRTLHHYDKIDLLKPSLRLANGYRVYSEKDLLKLQQIIALKFFGFELSQVKLLLTKQDNVVANFAMQSKFLQDKASALQAASLILKRVTEDCSHNKSIPWEDIIQLIEVYHMTQQLEHSWVKEIFNAEELKQYASFEAELKASTPEQKAAFEKSWDDLVKEVKDNLNQEPTSKKGIRLGQKLMDWVNGVYGKKYAHLRTKKFEKGFGEGKGLDEAGMTPEIVTWLEKAMDAYWRERIYNTLAQVNEVSSDELLRLWDAILNEMYGEEEERKAEICIEVLNDDKVSQDAKNWLKMIMLL
jgi:DNA-binding transcriptional MerR regulator